MRHFYLTTALLVLSAALAIPCWSADLKSTGLPQVQQATPKAPAAKPLSTRTITPGEVQLLPEEKAKEKKKPGARTSPPPPPVIKGRPQPTNPLVPSKGLVPSRTIPGGTSATLPQRKRPTMTATDIPKVATSLSSIYITSPKQGDFMVENDQFVIQWSGIGNIQGKCYNIYLYKQMRGFDDLTIAENVCVNGYNWQIPQGTSGTGFKIRVRSTDNVLTDNSDTFSILSNQPDLTVSNLHIQPASPEMDDSITVSGVIQNSGHGTSAANQAVIKLRSGTWTSTLEVLSVPTFVFGPNAHLPFSVTFAPPHSGPSGNRPTSLNITAVTTVDTQNQVTEADESNNSEQFAFSLVPRTNLYPSISDEVQKPMSKKVKIQFVVRNNSSVPAGPSVCRTWIENKGHQTHNVPVLGPGENHIFRREVFFAQAGWRDYSLTVDYGDNVMEAYEDDNSKTGRIHAESGININPPKLPPEDEANFPVLRSFWETLKFWD